MTPSILRSIRARRRLALPAILLALASLSLTGACTQGKEPSPAEGRTLYTCPMHPEYVSDRPGDCPICGMELVEKETPPGTPADKSAPESGPRPEGAVNTPPGHEGHASPSSRPSVPGVLNLGVARAQLAGVRTVEAVNGRLSRPIRAVGTVAADERRVRLVTTKVAGFIEKLHVNATGQTVTAGQPLFELYSPELLATQEEYLRARQSAAEFEHSTLPEVRRGAADLASSARRRLELFDVPAEVITRLEESGRAQRTVTFRAPFGGIVTGKDIVAGQRIEPGMELLTVTDLSRVWVLAQVYEAEAAFAVPGRVAEVTLPHDTALTLRGRIEFVYPTVDPERRTIQVRVSFPNPRLALKPGMFVDVELKTEPASGLIVPDAAVLASGTRHIVFVETSPGQFNSREVTVGPSGDGQTLISAGLDAGEKVAASANFLLDSESRLRQVR